MSEEQKTPQTEPKTFSEQLEVAGNDLVGKVQEIVKEGNARRLIIRNAENEVLMDINLTAGVAVGVVGVLAAWWIAPVAAIAAIFARLKIEVVREDEQPPTS
jgi:hypothetical protein